MPLTDDEHLGHSLRMIRRNADLTQAQLAEAAAVPRRVILLIEAGEAGRVPLEQIRRVFSALDGRARLTTWWHGAAADRLLDERHASITERSIVVITARRWETKAEVTFSEWGERGSIDIFGARRAERAVLVGEVKATIGSLEETNRVLDVKERLAPKLASEHFGFRPRVVGRVLILPDDMTLRRLIDAHAETMRAVYPARGREVRAWLRRPDGPLRGIWFISEVRHRDSKAT